jgi:hypothetical protein
MHCKTILLCGIKYLPLWLIAALLLLLHLLRRSLARPGLNNSSRKNNSSNITPNVKVKVLAAVAIVAAVAIGIGVGAGLVKTAVVLA